MLFFYNCQIDENFYNFLQSEPETEDNSAKEVKKEPAKRQISEAADDVLKIDCSEEVDEFTEFLNEFEDELKPKAPKVHISHNFPDFPSNHVLPQFLQPKKTKIIKVKKKVKKQRPAKKPMKRSRSRSPMRGPPRRSPPPSRRYR